MAERDCQELRELVFLVPDGALAAEESARVARHLERCSSCQDLVKSLEAQKASLAALRWPAAPASLRAGIESGLAPAPSPVLRLRRWLPAAAALVVGGVAGAWWWSRAELRDGPPAGDEVAQLEAEAPPASAPVPEPEVSTRAKVLRDEVLGDQNRDFSRDDAAEVAGAEAGKETAAAGFREERRAGEAAKDEAARERKRDLEEDAAPAAPRAAVPEESLAAGALKKAEEDPGQRALRLLESRRAELEAATTPEGVVAAARRVLGPADDEAEELPLSLPAAPEERAASQSAVAGRLQAAAPVPVHVVRVHGDFSVAQGVADLQRRFPSSWSITPEQTAAAGRPASATGAGALDIRLVEGTRTDLEDFLRPLLEAGVRAEGLVTAPGEKQRDAQDVAARWVVLLQGR